MFVSVVMAVYNGEKFIQEAIDSILLQTYEHYELIIVNDASTDNTPKILDNITNDRVQIIHLPSNQGAAEALNIGIDHAKGGWIAIHDADDISVPNRLERQVSHLLEHPELVALGSWIKCIPGDNQFEAGRNWFRTTSQIASVLYHGCPLTHGSVMFSRSAYITAGKYDASLRIAYDYDLWTRLITLGPIENVPEVLYHYRRYSESLSNKNEYETVKELFYSFSNYVRNTIYKDRQLSPKFVVIGSKEGCELFVEQSKSSIEITLMIYRAERSYIRRLKSWFKSRRLDGVILLGSAPNKRELITSLQNCGMEYNRNIFEFYSGDM
ncbi:glycosyltransferase [Bacillus sp. MM2020_1]|nr:glycosyltransferase [Bacillus sp. MM2020_1]